MLYKTLYRVYTKNAEFVNENILSIKLNKNIENYTNTCVIKLSKYTIKENGQRLFSSLNSYNNIRVGHFIRVEMGYGDNEIGRFNQILNPKTCSFIGVVTRVNLANDSIAEIECEDFMWLLKQKKFNFSEKEITVKDLANRIITVVDSDYKKYYNQRGGTSNAFLGFPSQLPFPNVNIDLTLKNLVIKNATAIEILKLLEKYSLKSYFMGMTLNVGINYNNIDLNAVLGENIADVGSTKKRTMFRKEHKFSEYNRELIQRFTNQKPKFIIDKMDLKYQFEDDVTVSVKAKVFRDNNSYEEFKFGDEDGEERQFVFYGDYNRTEVSNLVENELKRIKYEGFQQGSTFTTFGAVNDSDIIEPLDICTFDGIGNIRMVNQEQNELKSFPTTSYLITSVVTTMDNNGYRQIITIGNLLNYRTNTESIVDTIEKSTLGIDNSQTINNIGGQ